MPLSPHEEKALAALEEGLRADDPAFAAALEVTLSRSRRLRTLGLPLTALHVLGLVAVLGGLITAGALAGDRPALLAVATGALVLPWLIGAARSAARRSLPAVGDGIATNHRRARRTAWPFPIGYGALSLAVALLLIALAVTPPTGRAAVGLVVTFVVAPVVALRVMSWMDRRKPK
jgi:hypothetical protein